jgi:hypothetical protein
MLKPVALTSFATLALALLTTPALAKPGFSGFSGLGGQTCGTCHGGGTVPTVAFKVAPATLARGATGTYTFGVTGSLARTEIDIAAVDASGNNVPLTGDGTTTKSIGDEVIPQGNYFSGASKDYTFNLKVPAGATTPIKIYAVGMASNGSSTSGDGVAKTTFSVALTGSTPDAGAPDSGGTSTSSSSSSSGSTSSSSSGGASGSSSGGTASSSSGGASGSSSSSSTSSGASETPAEGDDGTGGCATGGSLGGFGGAGVLVALSVVARRLARRRRA